MRPLFLIIALLSFVHTIYAQCLSGNCTTGRGKYRFADGSVYIGKFRQGKLHGTGILKDISGVIYHGEFHQGRKSGEGKLTRPNGASYMGQLKGGLFHGKGKYLYENGDIYKGEWDQGQKSGFGIYEFASGDIYKGQFAHDQIEGKGVMIFTTGQRSQGRWHAGKLIDQDPISQQITNVSFQEIQSVKDCNVYRCHEESGTYRYSDGSIYTGYFVNGKGEGKGKCEYPNGTVYEGGWKNHGPHGEGLLVFESGKRFAGRWNLGVPVDIKAPTSVHQDPTESLVFNPNTNYDPEVKIYALIVGVASYTHMPSLKYTDDDAYQMYAFLKSPAGGAIPDNQIKLLIDDAATKYNIMSDLTSIAEQADRNDVVLVYISGHGLQGSYIPSDFDGVNYNLPYSDILSIIDRSAAKHKLCIADACHSGSMYASKGPNLQNLERHYIQLEKLSGGTAFMTSSKSEEVSLEYSGLRHGVFSHYVIAGLKGAADTDRNTIVTLGELYDYVYSSVRSYTNHAQSPTLSGDYNKDMPLSSVRFY